MTALSPSAHVSSASAFNSAKSPKVLQAARDFEAVLLGTLIKSLEKGFTVLPGGDPPAESDSYHDFETEALARGLAAQGGLGIARLIADNLQHAKDLPSGSIPKVSRCRADNQSEGK